MHSVVGDFEEERLLRVSFDETYRSFGDQIGHVSADLYRRVFSYRSGFPFRLVCW